MSLENTFVSDTEFVKLMTRSNDVDLTVAALELSRDAYPELDFQETFTWFDERVRELTGPISRAKTDRDAITELGRYLSVELGIHGEVECYDRPESSYLNRVITTGRGIPIALSVLYMELGKRLGFEFKGISSPAHFLLRFESAEGSFFIDPFCGGRILTPADCRKWLEEVTGFPRTTIQSALKPVGPRKIIIRMLNNLKKVHCEQENWSAAWKVQHRLTALEPTSFWQRKDLAFLSLKANQPGQAIDLLQSCLRSCPKEDKEHLEILLDQAQGRLALWN